MFNVCTNFKCVYRNKNNKLCSTAPLCNVKCYFYKCKHCANYDYDTNSCTKGLNLCN